MPCSGKSLSYFDIIFASYIKTFILVRIFSSKALICICRETPLNIFFNDRGAKTRPFDICVKKSSLLVKSKFVVAVHTSFPFLYLFL